jgi:hypothetical protein
MAGSETKEHGAMSAEIIPFKEPRSLAGLAAKPPAVFLLDEKTAERFFGFFTANIGNGNTRQACYKAACHRMTQEDPYRMMQRHAKRAGIRTRVGIHSTRPPASPIT